jgi:hypothetical protein
MGMWQAASDSEHFMGKASLVSVLMGVFGCFSVAQTAQPQAQYQQLAR